MAKMDGWDLVNERGKQWPGPDLSPPVEVVRQSHLQAFVLAKAIELHHQRVRPDRDFKRRVRFKPKPEDDQPCPSFKSWLDCNRV
jgi:hypothetical protein